MQSDDAIEVDFDATGADDPTLIATRLTHREDGDSTFVTVSLDNDGNEPLAKFLVQNRLVAEECVNTSLDRVRKANKGLDGQGIATSLLDNIVRYGGAEIDALLCGILERTKFAFIPLDCYDVDRQVVKMLPESLTLGRLIVPFDIVSRTVMVAVVNPFDSLGKEAVQQLFDYNIQWHLATPSAIVKVLRDTYHLGDENVNLE